MGGVRAEVHEALVDCVASGRSPTVQEVADLAQKIWLESAAARSALSWGQLEPSSSESVAAWRSAILAMNGDLPDAQQMTNCVSSRRTV